MVFGAGSVCAALARKETGRRDGEKKRRGRRLTRMGFCGFWRWLGIPSGIAGQLDLRLGRRTLLFHDDDVRLRVLLSLAYQ